jgi:hypothetical protein
MATRSDTHPPVTLEPAAGLRLQEAHALVTKLPDLGNLLKLKPLPGEHCVDFLRRLRLGPTPEEAVTFAGFALLPRQAVWWGHECLKSLGDVLSPFDPALLNFAAAWVGAPDEEHRYDCLRAAQDSADIGSGAWLCYAVGWSGGSMSAPDLPAVSAPSSAMGKALNLSLMGALARVPRDHRRRRLEHFIAIAEVMAKSA